MPCFDDFAVPHLRFISIRTFACMDDMSETVKEIAENNKKIMTRIKKVDRLMGR